MLHQIMYSSQAARPMGVAELEAILVDARAGNARRNVTGALVHVDGVFFQVLEGEKGVVQRIMASIAADTRHRSVTTFYAADVDARAFASWSMAYLSPTAAEVAQWAGLPGTASIEALLAHLDGNAFQAPAFLVNILQTLTR